MRGDGQSGLDAPKGKMPAIKADGMGLSHQSTVGICRGIWFTRIGFVMGCQEGKSAWCESSQAARD